MDIRCDYIPFYMNVYRGVFSAGIIYLFFFTNRHAKIRYFLVFLMIIFFILNEAFSMETRDLFHIDTGIGILSRLSNFFLGFVIVMIMHIFLSKFFNEFNLHFLIKFGVYSVILISLLILIGRKLDTWDIQNYWLFLVGVGTCVIIRKLGEVEPKHRLDE